MLILLQIDVVAKIFDPNPWNFYTKNRSLSALWIFFQNYYCIFRSRMASFSYIYFGMKHHVNGAPLWMELQFSFSFYQIRRQSYVPNWSVSLGSNVLITWLVHGTAMKYVNHLICQFHNEEMSRSPDWFVSLPCFQKWVLPAKSLWRIKYSFLEIQNRFA